jgi:hypothetical protein
MPDLPLLPQRTDCAVACVCMRYHGLATMVCCEHAFLVCGCARAVRLCHAMRHTSAPPYGWSPCVCKRVESGWAEECRRCTCSAVAEQANSRFCQQKRRQHGEGPG